MIRRVRNVLTALAAALATMAVLAPTARGAEEQPALKVFGYVAGASASPVVLEYNQPSFGLPSTPTFEARLMHAETEADSGPSSYALSSVLWPGDAAGNAPPSLLFELMLPEDPSPDSDFGDETWNDIRGETIETAAGWPSYPINAKAAYPGGPASAAEQLAAGIRMQASADEREAASATSGSRAGFPGVFSAANLNTTSFTGIRDGIPVAEASTEVKNLSMFGGVIRAGSVVASKRATSDGEDATIDGSVLLTGLRIVDAPIVDLTADGPRLGGQPMSWKEAWTRLNEHLVPHGITVSFLRTDRSRDAAQVSERVAAIAVRLDARAMQTFADSMPEPLRTIARNPGSSEAKALYDALPPQVAGFVDSIVQFDQSLTILLGDVRVHGAASPMFTFGAPPLPPDRDPIGPVLISDPGGPGFDPGPGLAPPPGGTVAGPAPTTPVGAVGVEGVPASAAVGSAGLAALLALALRGVADRATRCVTGAACSLER